MLEQTHGEVNVENNITGGNYMELNSHELELVETQKQLAKQRFRRRAMALGGIAFTGVAAVVAVGAAAGFMVASVAVPGAPILIAGAVAAGCGLAGMYVAEKEAKNIEKTKEQVNTIKAKMGEEVSKGVAQSKSQSRGLFSSMKDFVKNKMASKEGLSGLGKWGDRAAFVVSAALLVAVPPAGLVAITIATGAVAVAALSADVAAEVKEVMEERKAIKEENKGEKGGEGKGQNKEKESVKGSSKEKNVVKVEQVSVNSLNGQDLDDARDFSGERDLERASEAPLIVDGEVVDNASSKHQENLDHAKEELDKEGLKGSLGKSEERKEGKKNAAKNTAKNAARITSQDHAATLLKDRKANANSTQHSH